MRPRDPIPGYILTAAEGAIMRRSAVAGSRVQLGKSPDDEVTLQGTPAQMATFLLHVGMEDLACATLLAERVTQRGPRAFRFRRTYWPGTDPDTTAPAFT